MKKKITIDDVQKFLREQPAVRDDRTGQRVAWYAVWDWCQKLGMKVGSLNGITAVLLFIAEGKHFIRAPKKGPKLNP